MISVLRLVVSCRGKISGASLKTVLTEYHCRFGRRKAPVFILASLAPAFNEALGEELGGKLS